MNTSHNRTVLLISYMTMTVILAALKIPDLVQILTTVGGFLGVYVAVKGKGSSPNTDSDS